MVTASKVTFPSFMLTITGELYTPADGSPDRKGAAIVVSHPMTGVKEQTSAAYARALSAAGFYALAFDAGYQGESTGEPRGLEDPHQRVEDNKAAVTFLTTLKGKVDANRIGVLGICASGGYTSYAAQSDTRVKALGTVSAACVGRMTRNGGLYETNNEESPEAIVSALKAAGDWRNSHAGSTNAEAPKMFQTDASAVPADAPSFFRSAAAYYGTKRGHHPRSDQRVPLSSYDLMIGYDSFNFQHLISPRPKSAVEGAKEPKELFVVDGKNHFDLYDDLDKSAPKLVEFYTEALAK
ncbi:X-Pro dipeptidyl-peptidase (S15 family) protein [Cordyceps javanica]|uniref:X-Pro dipeptidyl-peptidase (S15 family) protein n=1 Tax=Cordyceps javanica TaxID=43265 RepID=A0A545VII1_9HYPO|nr:X-Pro dipeptidyl-peptidase (S15 family) protein [Cordyceps javanica]TQW01535.1 X-Pro dipeptidyl-peptidase (S15 family) protein [Cordyceps javanica]